MSQKIYLLWQLKVLQFYESWLFVTEDLSSRTTKGATYSIEPVHVEVGYKNPTDTAGAV